MYVNIKLYFKRSAPGAAKFEEPCALSSKLKSSPELNIISDAVSPTLYEGSLKYFFSDAAILILLIIWIRLLVQ